MRSRVAKRWSQTEVAFLEEKGGVISCEMIAGRLGRSPRAIESKRLKLGLHGNSLGRGSQIRSAFEVTAHLVDPLQRYQVLQQRYYEVMQCWEVALRQNNTKWYKTMRRLDAIRMELKQAMMFEVGRMA